MLDPNDIPRSGTAFYRLRYAGCNEAFPGAEFKDGVTITPVSARDAARLFQAFGQSLTIEPWESAGPPAPEPMKPPVLTPEESREEVHKIAEHAELVDDLDKMELDELRERAKALGLSPRWNTGADKLRRQIRRARRGD